MKSELRNPVVDGSENWDVKEGVVLEEQSLPKAMGVYITVHGHFYQPPRENPYLETIERQPSAYPYHDWNERILYECYRPNVFSRILNDRGEVLGIINNFDYLSFNVGPTLMSWLQQHDEEVYQGIIEADHKSAKRLNGHGNAIAQVYNHIILPLANERDKYTQIRWGKADFKSHFGREPEGMWLAETAVDYPTLEALVNEGIKFIILAPSQVEFCRPIPTEEMPAPEWLGVGGGQIDPTQPYRCFLSSGQYIDIFFYDGPISSDMGFDEVLSSAQNLSARLGQAIRGDRNSQLISVATDGETFGHHKGGTEKCLAYAFTKEFSERGWQVTNFAHYLSIHPPAWEVKLKPVTAWSCFHGVERWQENCGCGGGGLWHQNWRRPLRDTLNWLRDRLIEVYDTEGWKFFHDPWVARDEYIEVIRHRETASQHHHSLEGVIQFLYRHQQHPLSGREQVDALRLLEMQRQALLMFTSCGWFFDEISRPEGVQILRYAARAMELVGEVAGIQLEEEFRDRLSQAPSNVDYFGHGGRIYDQLVVSARIDFERVAAHYAITSLFTTYQTEDWVYCYKVSQLDYQKNHIGALTLAVGHLKIMSEVTWESTEYVFAVLHLGGWDFHCCIQPFKGRLTYTKIKEKLFESLKEASVAKAMVAITQLFGDRSFNLENLFAEERQWLIEQITAQRKTSIDQLYDRVYWDNYSILMAFQREELPVPKELKVAAEISLSNRCLAMIELLGATVEKPELDSHLSSLEAIATEAETVNCQLNLQGAKTTLENWIIKVLKRILYEGYTQNMEDDFKRISRLIDVSDRFQIGLALDRAQELYYRFLQEQIIPYSHPENNSPEIPNPWKESEIPILLSLGQCLGVDVLAGM